MNDVSASGEPSERVGLKPRKAILICGAFILQASCIFAGCVGLLGCRNESPPATQSAKQSFGEPGAKDVIQELQRALETESWEDAERLATQALIARPDDPDVLTKVAIAKAKGGDRVTAAKLLVNAVEASGYETKGNRINHAIGALVDVGRVYDAIELIEQVLQRDPSSHQHRRMLIGFLGEMQLSKDFGRHMNFLIRGRTFDLPLLLATTETNTRRFSTSTIEELLKRNPQDRRPRLGIAQEHLRQRNVSEAETVLREIIERHPQFAPAYALLGRALVLRGKIDALAQWHDELPAQTNEFPGYWVALGAAAAASGRTDCAVRAFGEATRRAPNDITAWTWLNGAIRDWDRTSSANAPSDVSQSREIMAAIDMRTRDLLELREHFANFTRENKRTQIVGAAIAGKLLDLGRNWEAAAWLDIVEQLSGETPDDLNALRSEVAKRLTSDQEWQSRRGHLELDFDLTRFPLPSAPGGRSTSSIAAARDAASVDALFANPIRLSEEAYERGLRFYGAVGSGVDGPLVPIAQTLGCGGGVIDIDLDGKHDLVFNAAGGTIRLRDSMPGACFRNVGSSFVDITAASGFHAPGFSHGVTIGDYNDDGFQDIFVLNFGRNSLFRNNGDGTFQDVSETLPDRGGGDWSTSAAIIDLNEDGYNDFVVVNYCDAGQPIDKRCFDTNGREVNCYPRRFQAGEDQFIQVAPDGRLRDVTDVWAPETVHGRGLGIVAGHLDGRSQAVYVVNDASANHYYRWREDAENVPLIESAVATGLAVDVQSLDQGSMGIASSDFDLDGDLDFYVTGFADEYNIMYEQQIPGFWSDETSSRELISTTLNMVGFGTEAVDLDNDGVDELVVSNGHVGDFGGSKSPYAQPLQVLRRSTNGSFVLADPSRWDDYFRSPHIGRALFTCDADSDGRSDLVMTNLTEPVALLVNRSAQGHHQIVFHLVDSKQTRDAIGAVVDFETRIDEKTRRRRLFRLSGHGYLCSNRPELCAGTGSATTVHNVQVTWPDGHSQNVGDLETDAEYLIVRGQNSAFMLREYNP